MRSNDFVWGAVVFILTISCLIVGDLRGQKQGYIDCLNDIAKNKKPKYILVEQVNRTTEWEYNKEYKYEP